MDTGLIHLHNFLRWVILITLLMSIYKLYIKKDALKWSKVLLISSHTTLLLGLYQYFTGKVGFFLIKSMGMGAAMQDKATRFWAVEHMSTMIVAIVFITIGHIRYKKSGNQAATLKFFIAALILILVAIPWPFRHGIGRPWFPGL